MDSQIPRQDGLDQNQPSGMEGQEDHQPGKRSVFINKVKAKARKIKDALTKKDDNADQDNNDETGVGHEEEDEMVVDSEVHESVPVTNTVAGQNPGGNLEKPTVAAEDRNDSKYQDPQTRPFSQPQDEDIGKYGGSTGRSTAMGVADVHVPEKQDDSFSPSAGTFGTPGSESAGNQSGYTERLSYATSAIANKAIAAKNVVASKLGYGGNQDQTTASESTQGGHEIGKPGTTAEYGQKIVATVTEKLAPVYEKVSSVGAPMYEKVSNAGSSVVTPVYEKVNNVGSSMVSKVRGTGTGQEGGVEGQDQGVSVKEYLAEKLRPGEEDKALSEVISDTLYTRKQGGEGEEGENQKPVGIVTESEEVRERLGSNDDPNREMTETESKISGNVSATGKGMVESVKGTVTSWFSRGGDQKKASEAASPGNTHGEEATTGYENGVGERRLQESGN